MVVSYNLANLVHGFTSRIIDLLVVRDGFRRSGIGEAIVRDVARLPGIGRYGDIRGRTMPVLDAARDVVGLYLRACQIPLPDDGPLLVRADGEPFGERDVSPFNARLRRITGGRIPTLAHLTGRFDRYVEWSARQDGTVERLAGRVGPDDDKDPDIGRLRRALRQAHPLGGGLPPPRH